MARRIPLVALMAVCLVACGGGEESSSPTPTSSSAAKSATPSHAADALASLDPAARRYVDAVAAGDLDALVASFASDATVTDVGREIRGGEAIRRWARRRGDRRHPDRAAQHPEERWYDDVGPFAPGGSGGFEASYTFEIKDQLITGAKLDYA